MKTPNQSRLSRRAPGRRGARQRLPLSIKLPEDMPEGNYSIYVCDDLANARMDLRDNPLLSNPQSAESILEAM